MINEKNYLVVLLFFLVLVLLYFIKKCKKINYKESYTNINKTITPFHILPSQSNVNQYENEYNKNNKKVRFNLRPEYKAYNPNTPIYNCSSGDILNPLNISEREKRIKSCLKKNLAIYKHSKKQEMGPVEYTNQKTHLGPIKNFHQCFSNGTHNMRDLGWEHIAKDIRKSENKKIISNNNDNPIMKNYLENMKYQNLENIYFN